MLNALSFWLVSWGVVAVVSEPIWVPSPNFNDRLDKQTGQIIDTPTILVLHYTVSDINRTLEIFGRNDSVSAHYTVAKDGRVFQHVDEKLRAWHAGVGRWNQVSDVNTYSIGIEHENAGYRQYFFQPHGQKVPGSDLEWYPFDQRQIDASIELCAQIVRRYKIRPENVVGHHDLSPGRKQDPGPLFPFLQYYRANIGAWQNATGTEDTAVRPMTAEQIAESQQKLIKYGYTTLNATGVLDDRTVVTVQTFQMHYRPANISGAFDLGTLRTLDALLDRYKS